MDFVTKSAELETDFMNQPEDQTVLVVNDDPTQLQLLRSILQKDGLKVLTCESAEEGLAQMQTHGAPAVLVTDLHMPGIDGWRFCRLLRSPEYAPFNQLPILVVSATFAGDHAQEITRDLGANAFLPMPCAAPVLREAVHTLLAGRTPQVSPKVLIVEDSPTLCRLLRRAFQEQGFDAGYALTGEEARQRFQELSPELVILDYHLPDLPGDTLLSEFKQAACCPAVIMITSDVNPKLATKFFRLGANGYLRKPFDPEYLISLCIQVRREQALLRVEDILEARTLELRESHARLQESEARLRESEGNYRLLVNNVPGVVFTGHADCSVDFYDDKIQELTGYTREEFNTRQRNWQQVILPEDRPGARQVFIQALKTDKRYIREYRIRTRRGDILWIRERGQIILNPDGGVAYIRGIFNNISDLKRLEEERLRLAKLESLGILAGGVAHDFNNLLATMLGNINLAALTPELPEPVQECLAAAEQACSQAQTLSQRLLTFARGGEPIKKVVAIRPLIQEATNLALAGSRCQAQLSLPKALWPVEIDPGQLSQALHDILINADQAMAGGGVIVVTAANMVLTAKTEPPLPPGNYVNISISDQGKGIDPKHLEKIFDPFFSTKQEGSGLGLSTAFSIIQKHGGHLTASSTPNAGSAFTIYLPASGGSPSPEPAIMAPGDTGHGKILVMDDQPPVRETLGKILVHLGYQVVYAAHGAEALEKFAQALDEDAPFAAVILDLTVPGGLGGQETLTKLRDLDPRIKAIVSSGYADDPIMSRFAEYGFQGVMPKPYRVKDIREILTAVLQG